MLEAELEQGVVDVIARARRVQAACEIRPKPRTQFLLDQEEEILDLSCVGEGADVQLLVNRLKRLGNRTSLIERQDAGLMQHHEMSSVDQTEALDMMILRAIEERAQNGFLIDLIGENGAVVEGTCGHGSQPFSPASITPRTM